MNEAEWEAEEKELGNSSPWGGKGTETFGAEVLSFRGALSHCPAKVHCALPEIKKTKAGGGGGDGGALPGSTEVWGRWAE